MFENFPYTDVHQLNLDWIIKIAKDFLDQYTHIQELIANGEQSLSDLTESGLTQLQEKADTLEGLLQQWYNTHSEDIADQLANALADLNDWYTEHQGYLDQILLDNIAAFQIQATNRANAAIESIPGDYTELYNMALNTKKIAVKKANGNIVSDLNMLENKFYVDNKSYTTTEVDNNDYMYCQFEIEADQAYAMKGIRFISDGSNILVNQTSGDLHYWTPSTTQSVYVSVDKRVTETFFCKSSDYLKKGTLQIPRYNSETLAQELGNNDNIPVSQKFFTDSFTDIPELYIKNMSIKTGTDLMEIATVYENKYIINNNNQLEMVDSNDYDTFRIVSIPGYYRSNNNMRFMAIVNNNNQVLAYYSNVDICETDSNAAYIYFSVAKTITNFMIGYGVIAPTETKYVSSKIYTTGDWIKERIYSKGYKTLSGNLSSGDSFETDIVQLKKNNIYSFTAKITNLTQIDIGHGYQQLYGQSYISVYSNYLVLHNYSDTETTETISLNFSLADFIKITITVNDDETASITIMTNGNQTTINNITWRGCSNDVSFVKAINATLTQCSFTWSAGDYKKPVWIFGDSYVTQSNQARWTYYLSENDYINNVLLSGYPGETSSAGRIAFRNYLQDFGKPAFAVWCYGMNDGSDSESEPNSSWLSALKLFLSMCNEFDITPILATIPTVPSINHEQKNAYVRNSGYRYIDFANAVGASASGVWYAGMLSSDNIHPTAMGAYALYMQAKTDVPEITFD